MNIRFRIALSQAERDSPGEHADWWGAAEIGLGPVDNLGLSSATEAGENPQWLYTVVFDGVELWGPDADPTVKVSIDAFEPYLEAVA